MLSVYVWLGQLMWHLLWVASKVHFTPKSRISIFLLTCSANYPSRLFKSELPSYGDISRWDVCLEYNGTRWQKQTNKKEQCFFALALDSVGCKHWWRPPWLSCKASQLSDARWAIILLNRNFPFSSNRLCCWIVDLSLQCALERTMKLSLLCVKLWHRRTGYRLLTSSMTTWEQTC